MSITAPLISVIIPVFNGERYIAHAIRSVLEQRYTPLEIIVVDDGSTDESSNIAQGMGETIRIFRQPNAGPAVARNRGLREAKGERVAFLDADDIWTEGSLERRIQCFDSNVSDVVLGQVQLIRDHNPFSDPFYNFSMGAGLFKRAAFEKVGFFDESLKQSEDFDWFMRAREKGVSITTLQDVVMYYRYHEKNMTRLDPDRNHYLLSALQKSIGRRRSQGEDAARLLPGFFDASSGQQPLVSVILAVRNGARYLSQSLQNILDQDYRPLEIIVVDGHSSDGTAEIAKSFRNVRYLLQSGAGIAGARNEGIKAARGQILAFQSHDDLWAPDKLSLQMSYLAANPAAQYVLARTVFFLEPGFSWPPGFRRELLQGEHDLKIIENLVVRRSLFEEIGMFDSQFHIGNDTDWFARLKDASINGVVLPKVLLRKRIHDESTSANASNTDGELLQILARSIHRKTKKEVPA